jgi:MFS family permease
MASRAQTELSGRGQVPSPTSVATASRIGYAGFLGGGQRALTIGLVVLVAVIAVEGMAVATVMPVVQEDLGGLRLYGLVFSGFMLANLVGITFAGEQTDRSGPFRSYLVGSLFFLGGLATAGVAPSMWIVVGGRVIQGFGGGVIATVAYYSIGRGYDEQQRPVMFALLSTTWAVAGVAGPAVGALIAEYLTWRLVFLGVLPLLVPALLISLPGVRGLKPTAGANERPDRPSLTGPLALGCALLLAGLAVPFIPAAAVLVLIGGVLGLKTLYKVIPAGTVRMASGLPAAVAMMGLISLPFFGAEAFLPLMLTEVRDQTATLGGAALAVAGITWAAGSWLQARRTHVWSSRAVIVGGLALVVIGVIGAALSAWAAVPASAAIAAWAVAGLGMGLAYQTVTLAVFRAAHDSEMGGAAASMEISNVLGVAIGTGIGGAVIAIGDSAGWETSLSVAIIFGLMAGFTVVAMFFAGQIQRRGGTVLRRAT